MAVDTPTDRLGVRARPAAATPSERELRYARVLAWIRAELTTAMQEHPSAQPLWPVAARIVGVVDDLLEAADGDGR